MMRSKGSGIKNYLYSAETQYQIAVHYFQLYFSENSSFYVFFNVFVIQKAVNFGIEEGGT